MSTATAVNCPAEAGAPSRPRPHGLDLAVRRLAVAMLRWSRRREERVALVNRVPSHREQSRRIQVTNDILRREADALRMTQRIGL